LEAVGQRHQSLRQPSVHSIAFAAPTLAALDFGPLVHLGTALVHHLVHPETTIIPNRYSLWYTVTVWRPYGAGPPPTSQVQLGYMAYSWTRLWTQTPSGHQPSTRPLSTNSIQTNPDQSRPKTFFYRAKVSICIVPEIKSPAPFRLNPNCSKLFRTFPDHEIFSHQSPEKN